jgi:hypothetical protein
MTRILPTALLLPALALAGSLSADPAPAAPAAPATSVQVQSLEDRLLHMQELMNEIELQAEDTKASLDKAKPQPISFGQGQLLLQEALYGPDFSSAFGTQALLGFNLDPVAQVHGNFDIELLGAVAPDRLLPQHELIDLGTDNDRVILKKSEIRFENDQVLLRAFRMVPHADFVDDGDLYYLFPAADDTNKYFRQSGRAVPNGYELQLREGWLKGLDLWAGDELIYGLQAPTAVLRYRSKLGPLDVAVMLHWDQGDTSTTRTNDDSQEVWIQAPVGNTGLALGLTVDYSGADVGQTYQVVKQVAPGQGDQATGYEVDNVTTTAGDATAAALRLAGPHAIPGVEDLSLMAQYDGILAGDKTMVDGYLSFRPQKYTLISFGGTWQKPLTSLNPTIIVGTPGTNFGPLAGSGPRAYNAIGAVTQNPFTGVNNREMTQVTAVIEYNPGQGWFYKYKPRQVADWNFNSDLDTPLSNGLGLRAFNYPTGTDRMSYVDSSGTLVGEGVGASGLLPTNGWLWEASDILAFKLGSTHWWLEAATGDQIAGTSPDFSSQNVYANQYFSSAINMRWTQWTAGLGYAEDIYGPDDWYQTFGVIIGHDYKASLSWKQGASEVSLKYEGWRDKDPDAYHFVGASVPATPNSPAFTASAPIDQLMVSYALNF